MSGDVRSQDFSSFFLSIHNDLFNGETKVTPFRSVEDNTTDGTNTVIQKFLFANSKLYGMGRVSSGSDLIKIYEKSGDVITTGWTASANGASSGRATSPRVFVAYKGGASSTFLYGFDGGASVIWAYDTAGGAGAFKETALSVSHTVGSFGLVTSDDLLLMAYDNKIAVKDGGTAHNDNWEAARLTLPANFRIVDLEEHGSFVAITCISLSSSLANSVTFLWDKVSPDVFEPINIGSGEGILSASIDGELLIVATSQGSAKALRNKLVLRKYIGGRSSEVLQEIDTEGAISSLGYGLKVKDGNRMSFVVSTTIDGVARNNMWTIGRLKPGLPFRLTMSQNLNNDTQPTSVDGVFKYGGYYFFAINGGTVTRTNNDDAYTATSTHITQKINGESRLEGASRFNKVLKWAGITCPPLPAGSSLVLAYRVNETTSWTTIFTLTTANALAYQQGIDAAGADFLQFKEIQFKLTTTGGTALPADWSSIDFEYEILDNTTEEL